MNINWTFPSTATSSYFHRYSLRWVLSTQTVDYFVIIIDVRSSCHPLQRLPFVKIINDNDCKKGGFSPTSIKRLRLECLQTTISFCFFNTLRLDRAPVFPHYAVCRGLETLEVYCAPPPSRGTSTLLSCPMWIHPLPKQLSNIVLKSECVAGALSSWTFFPLLVLVKTLPSGAFQILQLQLPRRLVLDNFMIVEPFLLFFCTPTR